MNKKTERLYLATILCATTWLVLLVGYLFSRGGFYIRGLDIIYCTSRPVCLHEFAHQADWYNGDVSDSPTYRQAVARFAAGDHPWSAVARNYRGSYRELYAQMLEASGGRREAMPAELVEFYNWDFIAFRMSEYERRAAMSPKTPLYALRKASKRFFL